VHQLTAKTLLNVLLRHPPNLTRPGTLRHKIVQSTGIMAHKIMASWLAGRRSYYPEALIIPS